MIHNDLQFNITMNHRNEFQKFLDILKDSDDVFNKIIGYVKKECNESEFELLPNLFSLNRDCYVIGVCYKPEQEFAIKKMKDENNFGKSSPEIGYCNIVVSGLEWRTHENEEAKKIMIKRKVDLATSTVKNNAVLS